MFKKLILVEPGLRGELMSKERILVVEDDDVVCFSLKSLLSSAGYEVDVALNGLDAMELIEKNHDPVILCDINLPGMDGKEILDRIKSEGIKSELILFTGYGSIQDAVACIKKGAYDYFVKPVDNEKLLIAIQRAFEHVALLDENRGLKEQLECACENRIAFRSKKMENLLQHARIAAETDATVLITGESGTGKTLLAKFIHQNSKRRSRPFVEVSCGALTESLLESELFGHKKGAFTGANLDKKGKFEVSRGGTIFLDDINSSSLGFQVKLLRVIEERVFERVGDNKTVTTDMRVIAATNMNLLELSGSGKFREDLYHRLNVVGLEMPSVRDRREDIPVLIQHFIDKSCARYKKNVKRIGDKALQILMNYPWPGNVRELENTIERSVIFSRHQSLDVSDLPENIRNYDNNGAIVFQNDDPSLSRAMEQYEKIHIMNVLKLHQANRSKTAEVLGVSRATLFNKMRKYGIM